MSPAGLDEVQRDEILRRDILPLYFPDDRAPDQPTFVLVAGQPGSGRSRTAAALATEDPDVAVLRGEDLRAFHPAFLEPTASTDPAALSELGQAVAGWVSGCIRCARENHRSLALEGTFRNVAAAAGTAQRFAAEGFHTRVVVVGSRRAESLLSVTSGYLQEVQAGRRAAPTSRASHDEGFAATRALVASVEESGWTDRLTVVSRDGGVVFDSPGAEAAGFAGAGVGLLAAQSERLGRFDATQWLSELHHATEFAATRRGLPDEVAELLVELHEVSLREVIPELHVPANGKFATVMERKTVARLVALRQTLPPARPIDIAAPVIVPGGAGVEGPFR
ncbi:zeta toxin family protein [Microbacterium sp. NPDC058062]|uniref:zeta toxin family protein n=1 Tax=Microbacterium sp. NPDC058062 TaxID=3346320 RepID=UPI0036D96831